MNKIFKLALATFCFLVTALKAESQVIIELNYSDPQEFEVEWVQAFPDHSLSLESLGYPAFTQIQVGTSTLLAIDADLLANANALYLSTSGWQSTVCGSFMILRDQWGQWPSAFTAQVVAGTCASQAIPTVPNPGAKTIYSSSFNPSPSNPPSKSDVYLRDQAIRSIMDQILPDVAGPGGTMIPGSQQICNGTCTGNMYCAAVLLDKPDPNTNPTVSWETTPGSDGLSTYKLAFPGTTAPNWTGNIGCECKNK